MATNKANARSNQHVWPNIPKGGPTIQRSPTIPQSFQQLKHSDTKAWSFEWWLHSRNDQQSRLGTQQPSREGDPKFVQGVGVFQVCIEMSIQKTNKQGQSQAGEHQIWRFFELLLDKWADKQWAADSMLQCLRWIHGWLLCWTHTASAIGVSNAQSGDGIGSKCNEDWQLPKLGCCHCDHCLTVAPSIDMFLLNKINVVAVLLPNHFDVLFLSGILRSLSFSRVWCSRSTLQVLKMVSPLKSAL